MRICMRGTSELHPPARGRVGLCFDTCHAFAAGYQLRGARPYEALWQEYDAVVGLSTLFVLPLALTMYIIMYRKQLAVFGDQGLGGGAFGFAVGEHRLDQLELDDRLAEFEYQIMDIIFWLLQIMVKPFFYLVFLLLHMVKLED